MKVIFISGSMRIKNLHKIVNERIDNIIKLNFDVIVGDASGVDSSIQSLLNQKEYKNVTVYCSGKEVRNNIGNWPVEKVVTGSKSNMRLFYTAKDIEMAKKCDYGYMVWDSKSTGTLSNVLELLKQGKNSLVFINKLKGSKKICNISDFEELITVMSESAFEKVDKKIQLRKKVADLKQPEMF